MQNRDAIRNSENNLHVVLREDNSEAPFLCNSMHHPDGFNAFARRHSRRRLIKKQQPWSIRQSDRKFETLLIAVRQSLRG